MKIEGLTPFVLVAVINKKYQAYTAHQLHGTWPTDAALPNATIMLHWGMRCLPITK